MLKPIANDLSAFGRYAPNGVAAGILALTRRCASSWAGKRQAFMLRSFAVRALNGKPLDVEVLGAKMRLYPYNNVCEKRILFTPQYFDEAERALIKSRIVDGFVFIDVGANIGGYTLFVAAEAGAAARILTIEPQPEIFERLLYNIAQNSFATVKALDCAVADRDGEITLFIDSRDRSETSMRMVTAERGGGALRVAAKSLKNIIAEEYFTRVDAIKLDVDGAEDLVLQPFFREAPESIWPQLLIMEHTRGGFTEALAQTLARAGYSEILRTENNLAFERTRGNS